MEGRGGEAGGGGGGLDQFYFFLNTSRGDRKKKRDWERPYELFIIWIIIQTRKKERGREKRDRFRHNILQFDEMAAS